MNRVFLALLASSAGSVAWNDWDKLQVCHPSVYLDYFSSEDDLVSFMKDAAGLYSQVKTVGAGHSFSSITLTDDDEKSALLNLDNYTGINSIEKVQQTFHVSVKAGTRLRDLNTLLEEEGLALLNLGATAAQSIAGAISTSTHGTGGDLGSISKAVVGLRLIDAEGNVHDSLDNPDVLKYGRVSLGILGIISSVTIEAVPLYKMKLSKFEIPLSELLSNHDNYLANYSRFQWSTVPYSGVASVILREEVPFETPITDGGCWADTPIFPCVDISYKTLVDSLERYDDRTLYTECEYFVNRNFTLDAVNDFLDYQESVKDQHNESSCDLFFNIRYVAADDIPLSPMFQRDIAVLSFICLGDKEHTGSSDEFKLFASGLENNTKAKYNGVPHWGKQNWATFDDLTPFYTEMGEFMEFREKLDPEQKFLNSYTRVRLGLQ